MKTTLFIAVAALALAGCETKLSALSAAPPGKVAEVDPFYGTIEISAGVALAFECTYDIQPCQNATAAVVDPDIAEVRPALLEELSPDAVTPPTTFLIIGKVPGDTTLRIEGDASDADFSVTVIE